MGHKINLPEKTGPCLPRIMKILNEQEQQAIEAVRQDYAQRREWVRGFCVHEAAEIGGKEVPFCEHCGEFMQ